MPAYLTHDLFGREVLPKLADSTILENEELMQAFLLGCQGPDPLFYAAISPKVRRHRHFGSDMHRSAVDETFAAFYDITQSAPSDHRPVLLAYCQGFICHYTLDSTTHPFVYAQQDAICKAGVKGLDERDGSLVHIQMESDLDMMMLAQKLGKDIRGYNYSDRALALGDEELRMLDALYKKAAQQVYHIDLDEQAFYLGVKNMRLAMKVLYSPRGIKRAALGALERIFRRHSIMQALSYRSGVGAVCDFDNRNKDEWVNPFDQGRSRASFAELYDVALQDALHNIQLFCEGDAAAKISKGLNFNGDKLTTPL